MSAPLKICFVCLGNICRSPAAEGVAQRKQDEYSLSLYLDSCGTSGWHIGESPDKRMQETMKSNGYDISSLKGRQLTRLDFKEFDYLVAMDENNYRDILELKKDNDEIQVVKLLDYCGGGDVPDPYYGGMDGFNNCLKIIETGTEAFFENLKEKV